MKKIETLAEYQQLASRTCVDLGSNKLNAFHMNSGIITEIGEAVDPIKKFIAYQKPLDLVNVGEELADMMWYVANKAEKFLSKETLENFWQSKNVFESSISNFNEIFHKEISQAITYEDKLILSCSFLHSSSSAIANLQGFSEEESFGLADCTMIHVVCEILGLDFWQILTNNIEKLKIRYPEKFTEENAINRDLVSERKALENEG